MKNLLLIAALAGVTSVYAEEAPEANPQEEVRKIVEEQAEEVAGEITRGGEERPDADGEKRKIVEGEEVEAPVEDAE